MKILVKPVLGICVVSLTKKECNSICAVDRRTHRRVLDTTWKTHLAHLIRVQLTVEKGKSVHDWLIKVPEELAGDPKFPRPNKRFIVRVSSTYEGLYG